MIEHINIDLFEKVFGPVCINTENISNYSEEEQKALYKDIPMTEKLFRKCLETAFSFSDSKNIPYIIETYIEFLENENFPR